MPPNFPPFARKDVCCVPPDGAFEQSEDVIHAIHPHCRDEEHKIESGPSVVQIGFYDLSSFPPSSAEEGRTQNRKNGACHTDIPIASL